MFLRHAETSFFSKLSSSITEGRRRRGHYLGVKRCRYELYMLREDGLLDDARRLISCAKASTGILRERRAYDGHAFELRSIGARRGK